MATLADILDALADTIRTAVATDIETAYNISPQIEPRMVLSPTPPTIDMYPADPSNDPTVDAFGQQMDGEAITVRIRVNDPDADAGQDLLLALMDDEDPLSIIAAINDDLTLNGTAASTDIQSRSGYTLFPLVNGDALLGVTLNLLVVKARS